MMPTSQAKYILCKILMCRFFAEKGRFLSIDNDMENRLFECEASEQMSLIDATFVLGRIKRK